MSRQVAVRSSIDDVRRGAYGAFAAFVATGLTVKFAWDRWGWGPRTGKAPGRYPLLFLVALVVALALVAYAASAFVRARRRMKVEDAAFARLREIRARLGIDP